MSSPFGTALLERSPAVVAADVDGELLVMSIENGAYYALNDAGAEVWSRIEQPCTFDALVDALARTYDADRATIAVGVQAVLERMLERNIVRTI